MAVEDIPDAIITRIRAQCAVFSNRVAGVAAEARAADQTEFAVPHAFVLPGGSEPEETQISSIDQEMTVRFTVQITVDNRTDDRGQSGYGAFLAAGAAVAIALVGWPPATGWAPFLCDGFGDDYASDRARLVGTVSFSTSAMLSSFVDA